MRLFKLLINKVRGENNSERGLTLVETLVAISILTIAVVGPLGIIAQALHTSYYTRDQMTAYYLAQEAIEYVRNIRDNQSIAITRDFLNDPDTAILPEAWWNGVLSVAPPGVPQITPLITLDKDAFRYSLVRSEVGVYSFSTYNSMEYMKFKNGIYGTDAADGVPSQFQREIFFI